MVSKEMGYSRASIYTWRKEYILKGATALINNGDDPRCKLSEGAPNSSKELAQLKSPIQDIQLEIDILKVTLDVLKKDPSVDMTALKNQEKTVIIGALKNKYSLSLLRQKLYLSRSIIIIKESRRCLSINTRHYVLESQNYSLKTLRDTDTKNSFMLYYPKKALAFQKR